MLLEATVLARRSSTPAGSNSAAAPSLLLWKSVALCREGEKMNDPHYAPVAVVLADFDRHHLHIKVRKPAEEGCLHILRTRSLAGDLDDL